MSSNQQSPPFYIMISQSILPPIPGASPQQVLTHPSVQFHYADDPPLAILSSTQRQVIVLDTNAPQSQAISPSSTATIVPSSSLSAQSISSSVAVASVRTAQPPLKAVAHATAEGKDPNIYIIELLNQAIGPSDETHSLEDSIRERDSRSPSALLARFQQRNALLRRVLDSSGPQSPVPLSSVSENPVGSL